MHLKNLATAGAVIVALSLTACSVPSTDSSTSPATSPSAIGMPSAPPGPSASASESGAQAVVGTAVRFSARPASVDVTIGEDNPAVRDFLSLLPLTLNLEEFNGREKIATLPRKLRYDGSRGSDPEDRDLIYYVPWGNIGFYYNTDGIGYSNETIHLGTYDATLAELEVLEGQRVTVEILR
jgi:hypothetical protein